MFVHERLRGRAHIFIWDQRRRPADRCLHRHHHQGGRCDHTFSDTKNYVIGPTVELSLPFGFAVEADALYRPLNLTTDITVVPQPLAHYSPNINSWEFPILGKYHFLHTPIVKPYVEAGPIFRHAGSQASYLSNSGFAIGGGVDFKLLLVRITPELRYSHWGGDAASTFFVPPSQLNQAEILLGISF